MSKPYIHALSSQRKYGGNVDDYMPIHELMDSSKGTIADSRHRTLTHNAWFISYILPRIFGETFENCDGKVISTRDIGEMHVQEDFGGKFIPSAQDYLALMEYPDWINNGNGHPPSFAKIAERNIRKIKIGD